MIFLDIVKNSFKLPSKNAMRSLNKIGMDYTVFYMFLLLLVASVPSFLDQLLSPSSGMEINLFLFIIYFFMFFYLPFVLIIFGLLSLLAYIALIIANIFERKLTFGLLWKLLAYTTTIPFLLYTAIALFYDFSVVYLAFSSIYSLILIIIMILSFPRRRKS